MDLLQLHKLKLWLLPPNAKGLAAARAEVIRRTAGSGAVILMDDDAKAFALTTRESSGRLVGKKLSFNEVVKRLMIAHQEVPTAMLVGIQHWYRHTASPNDAGAVLTGLQHMSFQPLLLNLPTELPSEIFARWSHVEDDEFTWRVHEQFGPDVILKLRYIIAKFDVGCMDGGLQGQGGGTAQLQRARAAQAREAEEIMLSHHAAFEIKKSARTGRLAGPRARLRVDPRAQIEVRIRGERGGTAIEKAVKNGRVSV